MFSNFFKLAWRNLLRNRSYSIINILGLSIGVACCMLILLWVADELSYDRWNEKADRTYRVAAEINFGGSHQDYAVCPAPLAAALRSDFPEVEAAVRFRDYGASLVKTDVQNYKEQNILYTDSTVFDVFSIEMTQGNPKNALAAPNTVAISESMAHKYFPNESPMGKILTFDDRTKLTVNGVFRDMPHNSHFISDFLVSLNGVEEGENMIWVSHNFPTYYVLREGADPKAFEAKLFPHLLEKYIGPQVQAMMGKSYEEIAQTGAFIRYHYQPLTSIHLHSDLVAELGPNASIQYVWIFTAAAIFVLLIACVNFMNLSTARSAQRAKEIGLRKVLGSMKWDLIRQFLSESLFMAAVSFLLALGLAFLAMPYYNDLAGKTLRIPLGNPFFWTASLAGIFIVGLLAGSYPAFYLSGFQPIKVLAGRLMSRTKGISIRSVLVVFQFFIAIVLILGTMTIRKQLGFIQHKKLGFNRDQVLVIDDAYALGNNLQAFKEEMLKNAMFSEATISSFLPTPSSRSDNPVCRESRLGEDVCVSMQNWRVDEDYVPTLGLEMAAGRNFSRDFPTDSTGLIINETAAKLYGFDEPIGQILYVPDDFGEGGPHMVPYHVIGVVKDFHYESMRQNIRALCLIQGRSSGAVSIKLNSGDAASAVAAAERNWKTMAPGQPFNYYFLDESFDRVYRVENRISRIIGIFSGLSILVSCLGLLGLAAFATEQRIKEIGVRKVLGASTMGIVGLFSREFLKLVLLAIVIATPLAWWGINLWLRDFAYSIDTSLVSFLPSALIAGLIAVLVAGLTVGFQSVKAALANPIESLRSE
ncbi:MAG: ABC transporter permease [Lewinellaceae bacterium]|nr:ABC transporter permease [Lewinella sp.]MCB9281283.1 ABC transporter permease [Lewinellaceae bacterium]